MVVERDDERESRERVANPSIVDAIQPGKIDHGRFVVALEAIYRAAVTPAEWPRTLQDIADVFGDVGANLIYQRDDGSFGFLTLPRDPSLAAFASRAKSHLERVRRASGDLFAADEPGDVREETLVHMTALPWLAFTAFTHARGQGDDRPKVAFGRFTEQGGRLLMPVAVDVHHALCDGRHVGRFFELFQANLDAI